MTEYLPIVPAARLPATVTVRRQERLEKLVNRLPAWLRRPVQWLRRPSSRWARIPAGILLILGGLLSFLPFLGIWKLPLGLALLAEDVPLLWRMRERVLDWIETRRPHWLHGRPQPAALPAPQSETTNGARP